MGGEDLLVEVDPFGIDLDTNCTARLFGDGGTDEGAANSREGVENTPVRLGKEFDELAHKLRRFVGSVSLADIMPIFEGVGGGQDAFGEIKPFCSCQFVERVAR